jgi:hypothetical protein
MRTVTEWLVRGMTAAAKRNSVAASQVKLFPLPILNDEISRYSKWSVWKNIDFGRIGHSFFSSKPF